MNNLHNTLLFLSALILLSSCSAKFRARNLPHGLKDYIAYSNGDTVFSDGTVSTARTEMRQTTETERVLTEQKQGKSFSVYQNNKEYKGLYYGKLNVMVQLGGYWVRTNSRGGYDKDVSLDYYLQRRGTNLIEPYTPNTLINAVQDNRSAVRSAKASKFYGNLALPAVITAFGGLTSSIFLEGTGKQVTAAAGLAALPVWIVSIPLSNAKFNKAVKIYNRK